MPNQRRPLDHEEEPGLGRQQVQTFVLALDKAMRAQRLYGGRGTDFVVRLLENLERELSELLADGAVVLGVASVGFTWKTRPLFTEDVEDIQLPWAFRLFCDGIREITFEQHLQWDELLDFLDILATNPRTSEEDLVTMLWERDFDGIRYYAADTFAAGLRVDENGELILASKERLETDGEDGAESVALAPDDIRLLSGKGHLTWLERAEAPSRSGGAHAWQAARLKSSLQDVQDLPRFVQLAVQVIQQSEGPALHGLALIRDQLDAYIARRDLDGLAAYIKSLAELAATGAPESLPIVNTVMAPARLPAMAALIVDLGHELDDAPAGLVHCGSLAPLERLLEVLPTCPFQQALEQALVEAGADLTPLYAERLGSNDPSLVNASIVALGRIGTEESLKALATVLSRPSTQQRRAALEAMKDRYHPALKGALVRALDDPLSANRVQAVKVLREAHEPAVVRALVQCMKQPGFEKRDLAECDAWYRTLASAQDPAALAFLERSLARRNLLRNRTVMAHQVLAARALGQLQTPQAHRILQAAYKHAHLPRQIKIAIRSAAAGPQEP